jgi:hypothetical protein
MGSEGTDDFHTAAGAQIDCPLRSIGVCRYDEQSRKFDVALTHTKTTRAAHSDRHWCDPGGQMAVIERHLRRVSYV